MELNENKQWALFVSVIIAFIIGMAYILHESGILTTLYTLHYGMLLVMTVLLLASAFVIPVAFSVFWLILFLLEKLPRK